MELLTITSPRTTGQDKRLLIACCSCYSVMTDIDVATCEISNSKISLIRKNGVLNILINLKNTIILTVFERFPGMSNSSANSIRLKLFVIMCLLTHK